MFQENKTCQIFRKTNFFYPLIGTRTCAYQGLKNVCFSVKFTCFVFLKHPFLDSPFCLITDLQIHRRIQNPAKHLKWIKKESLVKNNYNLELFRKTRQYVWQGSNTAELLNIPGFWICLGLWISQGSKYSRAKQSSEYFWIYTRTRSFVISTQTAN